jgi:hypothetical protein
VPWAKCLFYARPKLRRDRFEHDDMHPAAPALFDTPDRRHEPGLNQTITDVLDDVAIRRHRAGSPVTTSAHSRELNRLAIAQGTEPGSDGRVGAGVRRMTLEQR